LPLNLEKALVIIEGLVVETGYELKTRINSLYIEVIIIANGWWVIY
jgi:hypothetical protein